MSGTTTHYGIHYGSIDDPTTGLLSIQQQATDVDTVLNTAKVGTTTLATTGLSISAGSGWGSLGYSWQVRNGWLFLSIQVTRTGGTITAGTDGNVANQTLATITTYTPPAAIPGTVYLATAGAGGHGVLTTAGAWALVSMLPSEGITTGQVAQGAFVFPI